MENGVGARSANVKIRWSAERRLRQLCPERGALQREKLAGAWSGKMKYCKIRSADSKWTIFMVSMIIKNWLLPPLGPLIDDVLWTAAAKRRTQERREPLFMENYLVLHALAVRLKLHFVNISLHKRSSDNKRRCNVGMINKVVIVLGVLCTSSACTHAETLSLKSTYTLFYTKHCRPRWYGSMFLKILLTCTSQM